MNIVTAEADTCQRVSGETGAAEVDGAEGRGAVAGMKDEDRAEAGTWLARLIGELPWPEGEAPLEQPGAGYELDDLDSEFGLEPQVAVVAQPGETLVSFVQGKLGRAPRFVAATVAGFVVDFAVRQGWVRLECRRCHAVGAPPHHDEVRR